MNESKNLPKTLPPMELDFSIEVRGEITGKMFSGDFKFKIPNLKAKASAEKKRVQLNEGLDAMIDASVSQLHYMIAYLRYTLLEVPDWWKNEDYGYNLHDFNVIRSVFEKVQAFEEEYMKAAWGSSSDKSGKT